MRSRSRPGTQGGQGRDRAGLQTTPRAPPSRPSVPARQHGLSFFVRQVACVEETPQGAEPDREIVLGPQPGAHLLQGNVVLCVDQAALERLVLIELRATRPPLRTGRHRPGSREGGHSADRGGDTDPKARGRLPARGSCRGFHYPLAQILTIGPSNRSLLTQSVQ